MAVASALWVLAICTILFGLLTIVLLLRLVKIQTILVHRGEIIDEMDKRLNAAFESMNEKDASIRSLQAMLSSAQEEIVRKEGVIKTEKSKPKLGVQYMVETSIDSGLFRDKYIVNYKFQLTLNGIPVAMPLLIKQDTYRKVDKQQVNKILDEYAKPMLDAGIDVSKKILS